MEVKKLELEQPCTQDSPIIVSGHKIGFHPLSNLLILFFFFTSYYRNKDWYLIVCILLIVILYYVKFTNYFVNW